MRIIEIEPEDRVQLTPPHIIKTFAPWDLTPMFSLDAFDRRCFTASQLAGKGFNDVGTSSQDRLQRR